MPEIDFEARCAWLDRCLDDLAAAGVRILVADAGGTPAGFVTVDPATGHVAQLAVHPAQGGGGLAGLLIDGAKLLAPGGLLLDVNTANLRARRFYARHGFVQVSTGANPRSGRPTLLLRWMPEGTDPHPPG